MDAEVLARLRRHLALPRGLRGLHLRWLHLARPAVHARLRTLLAHQHRAHPLDRPLLDIMPAAPVPGDAPPSDAESAPTLKTGQRLGPWRIGPAIGQGGMGRVFRAERDDGAYRQSVAIKCLRKEVATPAFRQAFVRERAILATLSHPGIARLIDGGVEDDGTPWLAMELVDGQPLTAWCDARRLDVRARVDMVLQACQALAYAHRLGVLHLDISPANLLVTQEGLVKLVDFGIAGLRGNDGEDARLPYTEGYAAPEVRYGLEATAASDVYALGAVLAKLLLGTPDPGAAYATTTRGRRRGLRPLVDRVPPDAAAHRGYGDARRLVRAVGPDLYAVLEKCLRQVPAQRHASIEALQEDLKNWLRGRPVSSRSGLAHRVLRGVRRNRFAAMASVAAVLLLAGGVSVTVVQHMRNARAAATADAVDQFFQETLGLATLSGLGETGLNSRQLLAATEARLRQGPLARDPVAMARGLSILARSHAVAGDYRHAQVLITQARALGEAEPLRMAELDATLAGLLNRQGHHRDAERAARSGLRTLEHAAAARERSRVARTLTGELAQARWGQADFAQAQALLDGLLAQEDDAANAALLALRGQWRTELHQLALAHDDLQRAIALSAGGVSPVAHDHARLRLVRTLQLLDQPAEAYDLARRLLAETEAKYGPDHPETGRALIACAEAAMYADSKAKSADYVARAQHVIRASVGTDHPDYAEALLIASYALTTPTTPPDDVRRQIREAIDILERAHGPWHPLVFKAKYVLGVNLSYLGHFAQRPDFHAESLRTFESLLRQGESRHLPMPLVRAGYARALTADGTDAAAALAASERAIAEITRHYGPQHRYLVDMHYLQAELLLEQGRREEAGHLLRGIVERACAHPDSAYLQDNAIGALSHLGDLALRDGDRRQAAAYWRQAVDLSLPTYGVDDYTIRQLARKLETLGAAPPQAGAAAAR